jgi:hypothetical protein
MIFDREIEVEEFLINKSEPGSFLFYPRFSRSSRYFVLLLKKTSDFYRRVGVYGFKPGGLASGPSADWLIDFDSSCLEEFTIR